MSEQTATADQGKPPPRWLLKTMTSVHVFLNRVTGGFNTLAGDDVVFVTMTGAKSGKTRTIPLMYVPWKDGVLLVASQGGAPKNPVWYNNLVAHPEIVVRYRGTRMELTARLASDDEKAEMWPVCDQYYAPYAEYRARTDRNIPVFVCEPAA